MHNAHQTYLARITNIKNANNTETHITNSTHHDRQHTHDKQL